MSSKLLNGILVGLALFGASVSWGQTVTGSGTTRYFPKWSGTSSLNNSVLYQYTSWQGNGEYLGINTTAPYASLGILCQPGFEIFGQDSTQTFNVASGGPMYITAGMKYDGNIANPIGHLYLGGGGYDARIQISPKKVFFNQVCVGIGVDADTNAATQFALKVCGTIKTKGVTTDASSWCDDVFQPGYDLMTPSEVAASIEEHGHLPGIPSTAEVMESGINLGDMTTKLLRKVEELTLYVIALDKQNAELTAKLASAEKH